MSKKKKKPMTYAEAFPAAPAVDNTTNTFLPPAIAKPCPPTALESDQSLLDALNASAQDQAPLLTAPKKAKKPTSQWDEMVADPFFASPFATVPPATPESNLITGGQVVGGTIKWNVPPKKPGWGSNESYYFGDASAKIADEESLQDKAKRLCSPKPEGDGYPEGDPGSHSYYYCSPLFCNVYRSQVNKKAEKWWVFDVEGFGGPTCWVHLDELESFFGHYAKPHDEPEGKFKSRDKLVYIVIEEDGPLVPFNPAYAKKNFKYDSVACTYFHPDFGIDVRCSPGGPIITISKETYRKNFKKCEYDGQPYQINNVEKVRGTGPMGKRWIAKANLEKAGFKRCPNCNNCYPLPILKYHIETDSTICDGCYIAHVGSNMILPHNAKGYPDKLYTKTTRLGCKVVDGLYCATNKPVAVQSVRLFGAEVELELSLPQAVKFGKNRVVIASEVKKVLGNDFCLIKEDGTLTTNGKYSESGTNGPMYAGFEVVSAPADLAAHRDRWPKLTQCPSFSALRAWDTKTCGFHVHVSKSALTTLQIGRMLEFINHSANKAFIQKVAGRSEERFTRYLDKNVVDALHPDRVINPEEEGSHNRARRVALNVSNPHTVEFRIFRGTINPKHILRNIEFCDSVCDFCYPAARSLKEFSSPDYFIKFVDGNRKKWPLFAEWLAFWKFIVVKDVLKLSDKADKSLLTLKPHELAEADVLADKHMLTGYPVPDDGGDDGEGDEDDDETLAQISADNG